MYLDQVKHIEYRRMYPLVRVRRELEAVRRSVTGGGELPAFAEEFPSWAYGRELGEPPKPAYSPELVEAFEYARDQNRVSNRMLQRLDTQKLKQSGADI